MRVSTLWTYLKKLCWSLVITSHVVNRENIPIFKDTFFSFRCCYLKFKYSSTNQMWDRVNKFKYQFVSPRYQIDSINSTKERNNKVFRNSNILSTKSKWVLIPFFKTLLDLSLCYETTKPNSLISSFSQPKTSPDWHPHLTSWVGGETNEYYPNL